MTPLRMPTLYLPHGGGPCFFMEWTMGPPDTWDALAEYLRGLAATLPARPRALLVISAHWETMNGSPKPGKKWICGCRPLRTSTPQ